MTIGRGSLSYLVSLRIRPAGPAITEGRAVMAMTSYVIDQEYLNKTLLPNGMPNQSGWINED
jgi:hypothetical protein